MIQDKSLRRQDIEDIIGLTSMQQGMLFHYLQNPKGSEYFEQVCLRLKGDICIEAVKKAWSYVAQCNEMLRVVYRWDKLEAPIQIVQKNHEVPVEYFNIKDNAEAEKERHLIEIREKDRAEGIDISKEPFRITMIEKAENEGEMIITYHHILYDGWSSGIIIKEFIEAYESILEGKELKVFAKPKFKEYVKWQQQNRDGQLDYWKSYVSGYEERAVILPDSREPGSDAGTGEYREMLDHKLKEAMEKLCRTEKLTMATLIHAAWGILLQRYCNREDVIFGTTVSGRNVELKGIEGLVGLCINTLPFRIRLEKDETIGALLQRTEKEIRDRETYESASLAELQANSGLGNGEGLFDTLMVIENYPIEKALAQGTGRISLEIGNVSEATHYDLTIGVMLGDCIKINIYYRKDKYRTETIRSLAGHLRTILQEIIKDSLRTVLDIEMLSTGEKEQIINAFNSTKTDYPSDRTIHSVFEEQAEKTPDKTAIVYEDKRLTYRELNEKANQLARLLREKGVTRGDLIGIMMERPLDMVVGILGILKAGGAYLPIDPEYPQNRILSILNDSHTKLVLTTESAAREIPCCRDIVMPDMLTKQLAEEEAGNLNNAGRSFDLAYVMYTSGSTGQPKGVMIEHKSVLRLVRNTNYIDFKPHDRILQTAAFVFDVSTFELWGALLNGLELYMTDKNEILDASKLGEKLEKYEITVMWLASSLFNRITEDHEDIFRKCRWLLAGGDVLSPKHINRVRSVNKDMVIINGYGPTENTTFSTCLRIDRTYAENIPIGKPISNSKAYIIDNYGRLQPIGAAGELCVAGDGLARGYLNRPELTAEKFVQNPFESGQRMYRTGDLARWLPDGNIEFLGRIDLQVKIRGYRIELGEIENRLLKHGAIREAIVIARRDNGGDKYLCAYFTVDRQFLTEGELTVTELRRYLSQELPEFMIPSSFTQLGKMPLNENGKINKSALPEPETAINTGIAYKAARNHTEQKLVEIWQKVLGLENIGIYDNFFELSGHSLKAMQIVNQIHKTLNIQIGLKEFFSYQTIASLGEYLENCEGAKYEQIGKLPEQEYYDLSYAQQRLWIINQKEPANTAYNMVGRMAFNGNIHMQAMKKTFEQLIKRHESLRTRFECIEGKPVQAIEAAVDFDVPLRDLSRMEEPDKQKKLEEIYAAASEYIFDLKKAPLLTVELVKLKEDAYELVLCMHHIISDGWSMNLLREEFARLYEANRNGIEIGLTPLEIQYKDFAAWQNKQIEGSSKMEEAKSYWYEQLRDNPSPLSISHRYQGEPLKDKTGETHRILIEKDIAEKLLTLAKEQQTSLFMVLLSAFNILLMDLTGNNDILIGTPGSGREHESLERIIGYFINTIILRNQVYWEESFEAVLARVKDNTLKALEYQGFPIEKIVEEFNVKYPQITIFFNMLNMVDTESRKTDEKIGYEMEVLKVIKFDLVLYVTEYSDRIEIISLYVKELFKPSRIASIMSKYAGLLECIAGNPKETVLDYLN